MSITLPDMTEQVDVQDLIRRALAEDIGMGDVTSNAVISKHTTVKARIVSNGRYILSGGRVAERVFTAVDPHLQADVNAPDGSTLTKGQVVLVIKGNARSILGAERTALNFLQHLTGVATLCKRFVEKIKGYPAQILDTRKTLPTLRKLEKSAVLCGGGKNHRMGLYDRILIKDNHVALFRGRHPNPFLYAVREARTLYPELEVQVEVDTLGQLREALEAEPDWILLDNMQVDELRKSVALKNQNPCKLEASGGISLETVQEIAATGVDAISIGAITHSASSADFSLELSPKP